MSLLSGILKIFKEPITEQPPVNVEYPVNESTDDQQENIGMESVNDDLSNNQAASALGDLRVTPQEYSALNKSIQSEPKSKKVNKSILNNEQFDDFFNQNYFSRGRHNGFNLGSEAHFDAGRKAIISDFQRILMKLADHKRKYIHEIDGESIKSGDSFPLLAKDLEQLVKGVRDDIAVLEEQIKLSENSKGWVSKSINDYENGFIQGKQFGIKIRLLNNE